MVQGDEGAKFENFVAVSLLKHVYGKIDMKAEDYALYYLRTKDGQEVDFALVFQDKIEIIIEAKLADRTPSKTLIKFHEKYNYPAIQLVKSLRNDFQEKSIQVLKADKFLSSLFL